MHPPGLLIAYTDGSTFRANPGPISWAVVYTRDGEHEARPSGEEGEPWELVGAYATGTNNRAELMAVCWAVEHAPAEDLMIRSDSMMTVRCARGEWTARKNNDLWERFREAVRQRFERGLMTDIEHVKGHYKDEFNKRADFLASRHAENNFALIQITD